MEHEVLLKTNFTPEYKEVFSKVTEQVTEKIQKVTTEQISRNNSCSSKFLGREGAAGRGPAGSFGGSVVWGPFEGHCSGEQGSRLSFPCAGLS